MNPLLKLQPDIEDILKDFGFKYTHTVSSFEHFYETVDEEDLRFLIISPNKLSVTYGCNNISKQLEFSIYDSKRTILKRIKKLILNNYQDYLNEIQ